MNLEMESRARVMMLSKMAQSYLNLRLYEDALDHCNLALEIDKDEEEVKYIKAKVLSYLFKFKESIKLFKENDHAKDVDWVEKLIA